MFPSSAVSFSHRVRRRKRRKRSGAEGNRVPVPSSFRGGDKYSPETKDTGEAEKQKRTICHYYQKRPALLLSLFSPGRLRQDSAVLPDSQQPLINGGEVAWLGYASSGSMSLTRRNTKKSITNNRREWRKSR